MDRLSFQHKKEIGERLREVRRSFGLNQKDFSDKLNTKQNYLSRYENGESEIPDNIKLFLSDLKIDLNWLLTGKNKMFIEDQKNHTDNLEEILSIAKEIASLSNADKQKVIEVISSLREK